MLQHYVPKMYLKYFAEKKKKDVYYTWVFDCKKQECRKQSIREIAAEKGYNDIALNKKFIEFLGNPPQFKNAEDKLKITMENFFTRAEDKAAPALKELVCVADPSQIKLEDRVNLAWFFAILSLRVPNQRLIIGELCKMAGEQFSAKLHPEILKMVSNIDDNIVKFHSLNALKASGMLPELTLSFCLMNWRIGVMPIGVRMITSDNPVVVYNPLQLSFKDALSSERVQIIIPLTPVMVLIMSGREDFSQLYKKPVPFSVQDALDLFDLVRTKATQYLFAQHESDLRSDEIEDIIYDNTKTKKMIKKVLKRTLEKQSRFRRKSR